MKRYDSIIIGAGHNGLVCAAYLAKKGQSVLVLESGAEPGGCASTEEFHPGFNVPGCAQWLYQFSPALEKDLRLEEFGLRYAARKLGSIALSADGGVARHRRAA